jgi:hypothetical protein
MQRPKQKRKPTAGQADSSGNFLARRREESLSRIVGELMVRQAGPKRKEFPMTMMRNVAFGAALFGGVLLLAGSASAQLLGGGGHGGGGLGGIGGGGAFGGQGSFSHGVSGMGSGGLAAQPGFSRATNHASSPTGATERTANTSANRTEQRGGGWFGSAPSGTASGGAHAGAAGTDFGAGGSADSSYTTSTASNAAERGMSAANSAAGRGERAANSAAGKAGDIADSASLDAGGSASASNRGTPATGAQ